MQRPAAISSSPPRLPLQSIPSLAGGDELLYFFVGQFIASLLCCVHAAVFDAYRDTGVGETGPTGRLRRGCPHMSGWRK
jgi:hypothetical protein